MSNKSTPNRQLAAGSLSGRAAASSSSGGASSTKAGTRVDSSGSRLIQYEHLQPRLKYVAEDDQKPTPTVVSETIPFRDMNQPAQRYPHFSRHRPDPLQRQVSGQLQTAGFSSVASSKSPKPSSHSPLPSGRRVNSKAQAKVASDFMFVDYSSAAAASAAAGPMSPGRSAVSRQGAPPAFVGTTFAAVPNAPNRSLLPLPLSPTVPRPYASLDAAQFQHSSPQLHNRTAGGKILGSPAKRFVDPSKVPYQPAEDEPLGPDNPYKELDETWTACWDSEASAVYYYNKQSGEATWLPPE